MLNPFTPDRANSKIDKFCQNYKLGKIKKKNRQHHSKVLLNNFPINGHTLGFCLYKQNVETFVSPKVSLCESKVKTSLITLSPGCA